MLDQSREYVAERQNLPGRTPILMGVDPEHEGCNYRPAGESEKDRATLLGPSSTLRRHLVRFYHGDYGSRSLQGEGQPRGTANLQPATGDWRSVAAVCPCSRGRRVPGPTRGLTKASAWCSLPE